MKRVIFFSIFASSLILHADNYINPSSFDLRDVDGKNYINDIKDQGPFGTCYAFGAISTAEGVYNYTMDLYGENKASFSESFIIWSLGQKYEGFPGNERGEGAYASNDFIQAMVDYGVISDSIFPYSSEIMYKYIDDQTEHKLNYYWDEPRVQFSNWHRIAANDIETMKRSISLFGTLETNVYTTRDWSFYNNGIFEDVENYYGDTLEISFLINHSVSLVGWTDDNAWILRNSWGENWGEDGYMRIKYNSSNVSTASSYLTYLP